MYMSALNIGRTYYVTLLETETNSICPRLKTNHFQNKVIYNFTVFIIAISLYRTCHFKTVTLSRKSSHSNSFIMFIYKIYIYGYEPGFFNFQNGFLIL